MYFVQKPPHFLWLCLIILPLHMACSGQNQAETQSPTDITYELVKIDSIRIDKLETVQITAYHAATNRFTAYGTSTQKCFELDRQGNVLSEVDLTGEGPGHFGRSITELGYMGGQKIIHGPMMYLLYDEDWSYQRRIVYEASGYNTKVSYIDGAPLAVAIKDSYAIAKPKDHNSSGFIKLDEGYFEQANMLEIIDAESGKSQSILNYPDNTIYRTDNRYYQSHNAIPAFNNATGQLLLALPLEQKLYVYEPGNEYELVNELNLNLTGFREPKGIAFGDQHKNSLRGFGPSNQLNYVNSLANSMIQEVSSLGEINIVRHKSGFEIGTGKMTYQQALQEARMKNRHFTTFWKGNELLLEIEQRFKRMVRISEYQFISEDVNEEVERDFTQYFVYELRQSTQ